MGHFNCNKSSCTNHIHLFISSSNYIHLFYFITQSACGYCKCCRKVEQRKLPFDTDWVYL